MKILIIIHSHLDPNAGASGVTLKLGAAYEKLGHDVYYYSHDNLPPLPSGKLASVVFPYYVARHIQQLNKKVSLDIVFASSGDAWIWGMLADRSTPQPCLVTQSHGLEHTMHEQTLAEAKAGRLKLSWKYPLYRGSLLLWQVKKSFQIADLCFMLNQHDAAFVRQRMGVNPAKVKVFPNAIPDEFVGLPLAKSPLSEEDSPGIAFVATYIDRKGIQYGIPALSNVMQRYPKLRVSCLGTGVEVERVLNDFSEAVRERVTVVPSFDKSELPHLLKNSHILLFPSLSEGFPLAVPEAMACGLAPIITNIPGPTEIVRDHQNGLVVEPRNQVQLEEAMVRLINDREYLHKLRCRAYQTVQSYVWSTIAEQHLELYSKFLQNSTGSHLPTRVISV